MSSTDSDRLRRFIARVTQEEDQSIALARDEYLRLDDSERCSFRKWLESLAAAGDLPNEGSVHAYAKIIMVDTSRRSTDEPRYAEFSPNILAKAVAAWDEGHFAMLWCPTRLITPYSACS